MTRKLPNMTRKLPKIKRGRINSTGKVWMDILSGLPLRMGEAYFEWRSKGSVQTMVRSRTYPTPEQLMTDYTTLNTQNEKDNMVGA